jgi:hypothetical protein
VHLTRTHADERGLEVDQRVWIVTSKDRSRIDA